MTTKTSMMVISLTALIASISAFAGDCEVQDRFEFKNRTIRFNISHSEIRDILESRGYSLVDRDLPQFMGPKDYAQDPSLPRYSIFGSYSMTERGGFRKKVWFSDHQTGKTFEFGRSMSFASVLLGGMARAEREFFATLPMCH